MSEAMQKAVDEIGGEPFSGSGFEDDTPDPEFSDSEPDGAPALIGQASIENLARDGMRLQAHGKIVD